MLVDFLYELRSRDVKVSSHEWMALMDALALGLHDSSLDGFYRVARSICVKDVAQYDAFDEAFLAYFKDVHVDALALSEQLLQWLQDPAARRRLSPEELAMLESMDLERLRALFEQRLREQKERHDRGNRWIGTGGTSPFGNGGTFPGGLRVGGMGGGRSAMQVAGERRFRNYRKDLVLDVRQIDLALRDLRQLGREGAEEELDLDETVDKTCSNAGELELVFRPPRRNRVKLVLMMDVGGSMDPYAELVGRLFTAASRAGRFAKFRSFYFHNCVYEKVYEDGHFRDGIPVEELIANSDRDEKLVFVGDAWMHPAELLQPGGSIFYDHQNRRAGIDWLRRLSEHFRRSVWLNPEAKRFWAQSTIEMIARVVPMYPLSVSGIGDAVRYLVRGGRAPDPVDED
ncbi:vWA domain-containing protein [Haliangium ochraceum]|uniref:VWA containing CoxE family protein n=1 Tax=Haliangium ochraceum (strain DSM 14365 / JCM 11303 / SMP-2) TaxID=502025 RepID=D0LVE7_HALO1|nr:VWA domain-containing protein [Haliangium ochraceum]ACY17508.1 VWA containing CoxE family protein [Haliangium ochraceum DSM 14365]